MVVKLKATTLCIEIQSGSNKGLPSEHQNPPIYTQESIARNTDQAMFTTHIVACLVVEVHGIGKKMYNACTHCFPKLPFKN